MGGLHYSEQGCKFVLFAFLSLSLQDSPVNTDKIAVRQVMNKETDTWRLKLKGFQIRESWWLIFDTTSMTLVIIIAVFFIFKLTFESGRSLSGCHWSGLDNTFTFKIYSK